MKDGDEYGLFPLEDGEDLKIADQMIRAPELLFSLGKKITGIDVTPLPQLVANCISNCPVSKQNALSDNLVLGGGTSLL